MARSYKRKGTKRRINYKKLLKNLSLVALTTLLIFFLANLVPIYWSSIILVIKNIFIDMIKFTLSIPGLLRSYIPSMFSQYIGEWPSIILFVLLLLTTIIYLYKGRVPSLFLWIFLILLSSQALCGYFYPHYPDFKGPNPWVGKFGISLFQYIAIPLGEITAIITFSLLILMFFLAFLYSIKITFFREKTIKFPTRSKKLTKRIPKPLPLSPNTEFVLPPINLLKEHPNKTEIVNKERLATIVGETINSFGINGQVDDVLLGPTIMRVLIKIGRGTRLSQFKSISNELSIALGVSGIRIEAPLPGKPNTVAIEVPRERRNIVALKHMIKSQEFAESSSPLPLVLGLADKPLIEDIRALPHLLIGGSSGSGKTVCLHSIITGILYSSTPSEVRMVLIDPKRVEFIDYNGIPHLLYPVITEVNIAVRALKLLTQEMDHRYKLFEEERVNDLRDYNSLKKVEDKLPYILVVIDELADMISMNRESEKFIVRLAQKARAAGIHLIVATQRPTANVVTGLIKTNFSSRVAFAVPTQIDSRVILDEGGAEKLLGKGDMLFLSQENPKPRRVQGAYVDKEELRVVIYHWKKQAKEAPKAILDEPITTEEEDYEEYIDPLTREAVKIIIQHGMASTSLLQRRLSIGYARAARILDYLQHRNIVGPGESSKPRKLLITKWENLPDDLFE